MTAPLQASSEDKTAGITMLDIVAIVWMVGSLIYISVHLISYSHYKRQVRKKWRIIKETCILCPLFQWKRELHIRRNVCVMEYDEAESPMILGFVNPVLVLPKEQYDPKDLFFILKHELVHLKQGDMYVKLLFVTANAVHWFNPMIWIMQKEAVIDMELSCDERVTQGASYAFRKAYTETLLSMLHKQCVRKTVLSTQFYGGTKIMKKRFQNILTRNRKKNGIPILICAVTLSITLGMLVGCSVTKGNTETQKAPMPAEKSSADNHPLENTKTHTLLKEGESALSDRAEQEKRDHTQGTGEYLGAKDRRKIKTVLKAFAESYFDGDADAIKKFLASTYEGEIDLYESTGKISDLTIKGVSDDNEKKLENGECNVSIEFRDSNYEDMFLYLAFALIKEQGEWKIQFYGLEA